MSTVIQGRNWMVWVDTSATSTPEWKSIGFSTSTSLEITPEVKSYTTKDHGGTPGNYVTGYSWTATSENLASNDEQGIGYIELMNKMIAGTPMKLLFGAPVASTTLNDDGTVVPTGGWVPGTPSATNPYYKGVAVLSGLPLSAPAEDNMTFTANFTGSGAIEVVTTA